MAVPVLNCNTIWRKLWLYASVKISNLNPNTSHLVLYWGSALNIIRIFNHHRAHKWTIRHASKNYADNVLLFNAKCVSALILCYHQALIKICKGRTLKFCHTPYRDGILFGSRKNRCSYTKNYYKVHMCFF